MHGVCAAEKCPDCRVNYSNKKDQINSDLDLNEHLIRRKVSTFFVRVSGTRALGIPRSTDWSLSSPRPASDRVRHAKHDRMPVRFSLIESCKDGLPRDRQAVQDVDRLHKHFLFIKRYS